MTCVLIIGNLVLDVVNRVEKFPSEDSEVRAQQQWIDFGGNGGNLARVLCQGSVDTHLLAKTADDLPGKTLVNLLAKTTIHLHGKAVDKASTPCSYITLSEENGSRSIVHFRQLDELGWEDCQGLDFSVYDWIHIEARNCGFQKQLLQTFQTLNCTLSLEVEKSREAVEDLYGLVDYLVFSSDFISQGRTDHQGFLAQFPWKRRNKAVMACAGELGVFFMSTGDITVRHCKGHSVNVIDSIGAGDTFNAGFIIGMLRYHDVDKAVNFANTLAARKIQQRGFNNLISN